MTIQNPDGIDLETHVRMRDNENTVNNARAMTKQRIDEYNTQYRCGNTMNDETHT